MTTDVETKMKRKIETKKHLQLPKLYQVIYINDNVTQSSFVVETLVVVFNYTKEKATELTDLIHANGSAIVAILPYEIAEQKGVEVTVHARNNGFPLQVKLVPES